MSSSQSSSSMTSLQRSLQATCQRSFNSFGVARSASSGKQNSLASQRNFSFSASTGKQRSPPSRSSSSGTGMMRASLHMAANASTEFMGGLLPSSTHKKTSQRHTSVTNIFCSEMVGQDSILADFDRVTEDTAVTQLEIEDMLTSQCHHQLTAAVGKLVFANDRPWETIRFLDSLDLPEFGTWHLKKESIMRDYERCWVHLPSSHTKGVITLKAIVTIPEGTPVPELLQLFKTVKEDQDVAKMSLHGILSLGEELITAKELVKSIDWSTTTLEEPLSMELECNWTTTSQETRCFRLILDSCVRQLKQSFKQNRVELATNSHHSQGRRCEGEEYANPQSPHTPKTRMAQGGSLMAMRRSLQSAQQEEEHIAAARRQTVCARPTMVRSIASAIEQDQDTSVEKRRRKSSMSSLKMALSDSGDCEPRRARRRSRGAVSASSLQRAASDQGDRDNSTLSRYRDGRSSLQTALRGGKRGNKNKSEPVLARRSNHTRNSQSPRRRSAGSFQPNATWECPKMAKTKRQSTPNLAFDRYDHDADDATSSSHDSFADDDSEYRRDLEEPEQEELQRLQLREVELLAEHTESIDLVDLVAMRKTLDAAIASMAEEQKKEHKERHSMAYSRDEDGPDYDWARGVFCRHKPRSSGPRAA